MRTLVLMGLSIVLATSCTPDAPTVSPRPSDEGLPSEVTVGGGTFDVSCTPVAEALVDIKLPHEHGEPMIRAITGLWRRQAVAVLANDREGCGVWALGLAHGLSQQATDAIDAEVAAGVQRFGVTAAPVPKDDGNG
jgi:hypothetical protein